MSGPEPKLIDGVPCGHPGCCNHITHPCEGCGRIGCVNEPEPCKEDSYFLKHRGIRDWLDDLMKKHGGKVDLVVDDGELARLKKENAKLMAKVNRLERAISMVMLEMVAQEANEPLNVEECYKILEKAIKGQKGAKMEEAEDETTN